MDGKPVSQAPAQSSRSRQGLGTTFQRRRLRPHFTMAGRGLAMRDHNFGSPCNPGFRGHPATSSPFRVRGFHSDNGSEFLNQAGSEKLLNKLLVGEFTKSRAHRTTDNALVEGKNGAVAGRPSTSRHEPYRRLSARPRVGCVSCLHRPSSIRIPNYHRPQTGSPAVERGLTTASAGAAIGSKIYRTPYEKLLSLEGNGESLADE